MVVFCYNTCNKYQKQQSMGIPFTPIRSARNMPKKFGNHMGYTSTPGVPPPAKKMPPDAALVKAVSGGIFIFIPERPRMKSTPGRLKHFSAGLVPRDMRELCRVRNLVYYGGAADEAWLTTADRIRRDYISRVGLRQYLLEMLPSKIAVSQASQCAVVLADGTAVSGRPSQHVVDFLLEHFSEENLPYRLDIRRNLSGKIEHLTYSL
jgi:hypothetical protein